MIRKLARLSLPAIQAIGLVLGICALSFANNWKLDVIHLKEGKTLSGLVLEENQREVRFRYIVRKPGAATTVITTTIPLADIDHIDRLDDKDREILIERIAGLDSNGKQEAVRMEGLKLEQGRWPVQGKGAALLYKSKYFHLISNCEEDIVRRSGVRLDQLFTAFIDYLPPTRSKGKPVKIYLVRTLNEYHALLKTRNVNMVNPAYYDPDRNEVVCASNLEQLGADLEKVRKEHHDLLKKLKEQEAELAKEFKNKIPPSIQKQIANTRQRIVDANAKNSQAFQDATKQLFQTLYHEAFHAYLANWVYGPDETEVPRWLNEGLAQIFESAIVESGELRVGHADKVRLEKIKTLLQKNELMDVATLLKSGPKNFLVGHNTDKQPSDAYYLNSWALAFYLTFDRKVLGTPALDDYVTRLKRGRDPVESFRLLVDKPLADFEKDYKAYLQNLKPDGTSGKTKLR